MRSCPRWFEARDLRGPAGPLAGISPFRDSRRKRAWRFRRLRLWTLAHRMLTFLLLGVLYVRRLRAAKLHSISSFAVLIRGHLHRRDPLFPVLSQRLPAKCVLFSYLVFKGFSTLHLSIAVPSTALCLKSLFDETTYYIYLFLISPLCI